MSPFYRNESGALEKSVCHPVAPVSLSTAGSPLRASCAGGSPSPRLLLAAASAPTMCWVLTVPAGQGETVGQS